MRALTTTLLAAMLPLVAATLLLGAYLNYASVRTHLIAIIGDRLETAARRVSSDAQTALSLGLSLPGQTTLTRNLMREAAADAAIGTIDVVDGDVILFSNVPARVGTVPDVAFDPLLSRQSPVVSPFGTVAGVVVARASHAALEETVGRLAGAIAIGAAAAMAASLIAIAVLMLWTVRALWRRMTAQATTRRGDTVPAEIAATINDIDAAHGAIAQRLGG